MLPLLDEVDDEVEVEVEVEVPLEDELEVEEVLVLVEVLALVDECEVLVEVCELLVETVPLEVELELLVEVDAVPEPLDEAAVLDPLAELEAPTPVVPVLDDATGAPQAPAARRVKAASTERRRMVFSKKGQHD